MNKQPERKAQTRQKLMNAFWQLYCEKKIERITVREIVGIAGVYRSTFYEYFLDVYDVLETIETELLNDFQAANARSLASDTLDDLIENLLNFYEQNGEYIAVLLGPNGDPAFSSRAMGIIKESLSDRLHLSHADRKADLLFYLIASSIITMLNYWYAHQNSTTLREIFMLGWPLLKNGLLPIAEGLDGISGVHFLEKEHLS